MASWEREKLPARLSEVGPGLVGWWALFPAASSGAPGEVFMCGTSSPLPHAAGVRGGEPLFLTGDSEEFGGAPLPADGMLLATSRERATRTARGRCREHGRQKHLEFVLGEPGVGTDKAGLGSG